MENVTKSGESLASKLKSGLATAGRVAATGIGAITAAAGAAVGGLLALEQSTEEYRIAMGLLNTAFESAGYGADAANQAYSEFYGILGDTDRATEASQLLAKLAENEEDLAEWTNIAAGVNGTFGDSLPIESLIEAANETARTGTVVGTLADALNWAGTVGEDEFNAMLASCSSESERNQLIMETLAGTYDDAADSFYRNNEALVSSREAQVQMDNVLAQLGKTVSTVKSRLTTEFIPAISDVASAFNGVITGAQGADQRFSAAIENLVSTAVSKLPEFLSFGTQIISSLLSGIVQSIPTLIAAIPTIINEIGAALTGLFPQVVDMGVSLLDQFTSGIETGLPDMVARLPQIIQQFLQFVTENLPSILEKGVEILNSLITGIINSIPKLIAALPQIITSITKFIADNLPEIVNAGISILLNLITGIISAIPELVAALPQIISAIVDGIGNLMGGIIDIGANIVNGIKTGIQKAWSTFVNWVGDLFENSLVGKVLNVLGIHSPSRVFAGIGENMVLGLGEGWEKEYGHIRRDIEKDMDFGTANVDFAASALGAASAGAINGISSAVRSNSTPGQITVNLMLPDGTKFASYLLGPLVNYAKANGTPILNPT